jgi:hypothetical protein
VVSDAATLERSGRKASPAPARWWALGALVVVLLAVFVGRTALARTQEMPRLSDLLDTLTVLGSAAVVAVDHRRLTRRDWLVGLGVGLLIGVQLPFATLFRPYPWFGVLRGGAGQAIVRGAYTAVAALGGLAIARGGGPVRVRLAEGPWRRALGSLLLGAGVGLPLAVLNAYANAWVQGRAFAWQSPLAAALDALQPAVVEEAIYRLAFLSLVWLVLRRAWPERQAAWLSGVLALLVHTYYHYSDEFLAQPLLALGMGAVMGLVWGLPLTVLALRRDLDAAVGFHWVQDAARFLVGL